MKRICLIAGVLAVLSGVLLYMYMDNTKAALQASVAPTVSAVSAACDIPAHTEITEAMIEIVQLPEGSVHPKAARTAEEVIGKVSDSTFVAGETVIASKLTEPGGKGDPLSYRIPSDFRAMTLTLEYDAAVGGKITKGDHIDIIVTSATKGEENVNTSSGGKLLASGYASTIALSGVEVIGVSSDTKQSAEGALSGKVTLTLAMTAGDCVKLHNASMEGTLCAILLPRDDMSKVDCGSMSSSMLYE